MRGGDCSRWTNVDAALARSAVIANRLIRRQVKRRQNFGEKEPGPKLRIEQHGAFSVACAGSPPAATRHESNPICRAAATSRRFNSTAESGVMALSPGSLITFGT